MKKTLEPRETPVWGQVLAYLEEQQQGTLAAHLKSGTLAAHLDRETLRIYEGLAAEGAVGPLAELESETLTQAFQANPEREEQPGLNAQERSLLAAFKRKNGIT